MAVAELTDLSHWEAYWTDFRPQAFTSHKIDPLVADLPDGLTSLEVGGFPGQMSAYLCVKKNFDISIVDFYVDEQLVLETEAVFGLEPGTIKWTKADFFSHGLSGKYGLVHSYGFIEHFEDPRDILARHLELTEEGGYVLVTMPNLSNSFYGWLVKRYDPELYASHNVKVMDTSLLARCCQDLGVKDYQIRFFGEPGEFWVPEGRVKPAPLLFYKLIRKTVKTACPGMQSRRWSPSIGILIEA